MKNNPFSNLEMYQHDYFKKLFELEYRGIFSKEGFHIPVCRTFGDWSEQKDYMVSPKTRECSLYSSTVGGFKRTNSEYAILCFIIKTFYKNGLKSDDVDFFWNERGANAYNVKKGDKNYNPNFFFGSGYWVHEFSKWLFPDDKAMLKIFATMTDKERQIVNQRYEKELYHPTKIKDGLFRMNAWDLAEEVMAESLFKSYYLWIEPKYILYRYNTLENEFNKIIGEQEFVI